jgi:hypothetical protein
MAKIKFSENISEFYDPILGFRGLPDDFFVQLYTEIPQQQFQTNNVTMTTPKPLCNKQVSSPRRHGKNNHHIV